MLSCFREARAYRRASQCVRQSQTQLLKNLVTKNRETWFGRHHRFDSIQSVEDFQRVVPLSRYEDYTASVGRIGRGEQNRLTAEPVELLEPTSGTTAGEKLIPYTAGLKRSFQRAIRAWIWDLFSNRPGLRNGYAFWSISPLGSTRRTSQSGIPIGFDDDAGYLGNYEQRFLAKSLAVPPSVALCPDVPSAQYATLFFLLRCPQLSLMSIWSPTFLQELLTCLQNNWEPLCENVERGLIAVPKTQELPSELLGAFGSQPERANLLRDIFSSAPLAADWVGQIWPQLSMVSCWADGPSAMYAENLRRRLPNIEIQPKGLLATEAFISFPLLLHRSAGHRSAGHRSAGHRGASLAVRSHFFEFLSADSSGKISEENAKLADELQLGMQYQVVVTTAGGLYRYQMMDQVEVVGFNEQVPLIRFVGKCDNTSDLVGEKLNAAHVQALLEREFDSHHLSPTYVELVAQETPSHCYILQIVDKELANDKQKQARLCEKIDTALKSNPGYRYARELGQLGDLRLINLSQKEADEFNSERSKNFLQSGVRHGDIKPSILSRSTHPLSQKRRAQVE